MTEKNVHGLSKHRGSDVERALRREAGFGCLGCGYIRGDYHHIDPEFADAKIHDPSKMAFLCKRCHGEASALPGLKEQVWEWKRNPYVRRERATLPFPIYTAVAGCVVRVGPLEFRDCSSILTLNGDALLCVAPPPVGESMLRVTGRFFDKSGKLVLLIEDNKIQLNAENWDVTVVGEHLKIWAASGEPVLDLAFDPPEIRVHKLRTAYQGIDVDISSGQVRIAANELRLTSAGDVFIGCASAISGTVNEILLGDADPARGMHFLRDATVAFEGNTFVGGVRATGRGEMKMRGNTIHGTRSLEATRQQLVRGWRQEEVTAIGGDAPVVIPRRSVQGLWSVAWWPGVATRHPSGFPLAHRVLMSGHALANEVQPLITELRAIATEIVEQRAEISSALAASNATEEDLWRAQNREATMSGIDDAGVAALISAAEGAARLGNDLKIV